jgi:predicted metal-dependent hydrolase
VSDDRAKPCARWQFVGDGGRGIGYIGTMRFLFRPPAPQPAEAIQPIELPDGTCLPVTLRRSERARRIALKLRVSQPSVELVLPSGASLARALAFLDSRRGWIAAQSSRLPTRIPFVDGAAIPILGVEHRLTSLGPRRGVPPFRIADRMIEVTGHADHLARRTEAGLRAHARQLLADKTGWFAAKLGRPAGKISIGDAASRWGSCSAAGNIKYSWRLVLAPERVLEYVVAHEAAHLAEMNHSARFWAVVESLYGPFEAERNWLKRNGTGLMRYG